MSVNTATPQTTDILVIFGSPHSNGYTSKLLDEFLSALPENVIIHLINAYNLNALPCTDCGYCKLNDGCVNNDLDKFNTLYCNADIVVYATPIYNLSFPSPLKAIIDRSQRYFNARFCRNIKPAIQKPKKAILLATCGSENTEITESAECSLKQMFTVMNTWLFDSVLWCATDVNPEKYMPVAFERAKRIAKIIIK